MNSKFSCCINCIIEVVLSVSFSKNIVFISRFCIQSLSFIDIDSLVIGCVELY